MDAHKDYVKPSVGFTYTGPNRELDKISINHQGKVISLTWEEWDEICTMVDRYVVLEHKAMRVVKDDPQYD